MTASEIKEKIAKFEKGIKSSAMPENFKAGMKAEVEKLKKELETLESKKEEEEPKKEAPKKEPKEKKPSAPKEKSMTYEQAMAILKKDPDRLKKDCETILARETVRKENAKESSEKYEAKSGGAKVVGAGEKLADGIARESKKVEDKSDLRKLAKIVSSIKSLVGEAKDIIEGRGLSKEEIKEFENALDVIKKYIDRPKK